MSKNVVADLTKLEEAVQAILAGTRAPMPAGERMTTAIVEAVLTILDRYAVTDLAALPDGELERLIGLALEAAFPNWSGAFGSEVSSRLAGLVELTAAFYQNRGINIDGTLDAVRRAAEVGRLTDAFERGLTEINETMRLATVEVMTEAIMTGEIDREHIAAEIQRITGRGERLARVQTQVALASYNQEYRNEVSRRAGLDWFWYHGSLQRNTRQFCRIHRDRVFTRAQVEQMDNSMLKPVLTYRGGWNCIHSWLPVDPSWSDELAAKAVPEDLAPTVIPLQGKRRLVVFAQDARVARLQVQMRMETGGVGGFEQFFDAGTNDVGFVALHRSWFTTLDATDHRTKAYRRLRRLRALATELAERGHAVELSTETGADLVVDGKPFRMGD